MAVSDRSTDIPTTATTHDIKAPVLETKESPAICSDPVSQIRCSTVSLPGDVQGGPLGEKNGGSSSPLDDDFHLRRRTETAVPLAGQMDDRRPADQSTKRERSLSYMRITAKAESYVNDDDHSG
ncbi:unnamed protein product [Soboliphyme baturini]|uniref:Uncharacterized protein n=1 Tax=Soboliphyme baturini TaxID=241478 RepID=A0A183IDW3_9BILA|nr:unnamed protein product [Soboliphyme baturini]